MGRRRRRYQRPSLQMSLHIGHDCVWKISVQFHGPELRKPRVTPSEGFTAGVNAGLPRVKTVVACISPGGHVKLHRSKPVAAKDSKERGNSASPDKFSGAYSDAADRAGVGVEKSIDVVTLGNLCLDIVLNVPVLPPTSLEERYQYMLQLAASNPDKRYWEAGGTCNFSIAAARLGLHCAALGQIGNEKYGWFLREVMEKEDVSIIGIDRDGECLLVNNDETVLCWVLVDAARRHSFCSRFDFNKEPAFSWINKLSAKAERAIKQSKVLFCNGFAFDEFSPGLIVSALEFARDAGTAIFFDPGPRNKSLLHGTPEQQATLQKILSISDVLLLTADEAESLTGLANPALAAQNLLHRGLFTKWVIIKMGSGGSMMVTSKGLFYAPALKVDVADTVGCGDSFAAAIVVGYINLMPMITTLVLANAVGGATAMGCGAGRNVATKEKVCELLLASEVNNDYEDFWRRIRAPEYFSKSEIMLAKRSINCQDNSFHAVEVQDVARDALNLFKKGSKENTLHIKMNA